MSKRIGILLFNSRLYWSVLNDHGIYMWGLPLRILVTRKPSYNAKVNARQHCVYGGP